MRHGWQALGIALVVMAPALRAQQSDSVTSRVVVPGVTHRHLLFGTGPWSVNVLEVDLRNPDLALRAVRADDRFHGREKLSSMAARSSNDSMQVVGAINADFFSLASGENENNQVLAGEIWKAVRVTSAPADSHHTVHSQFAINLARQPLIERFAIHSLVIPASGAPMALDAVNSWPDSNALVLYTRRIGLMTPADSAGRRQTELPLTFLRRNGDTAYYRISGRSRTYGASLSGGAAIAAGGSAATRLAALGDSGSTLRVVTGLTPDRGAITELVGGWPRLIVHGRSIADSADMLEGTFPRFSVTRHPRTGIGFSRDSSTLFLITVDGRQESSSGMSLMEFANLMLSLGVYEGLNLDGGGSTTMVVDGTIVNRPSDSEGERTVGNGLLITRRKPRP